MNNKKLELMSYEGQCGMYFTKILPLDNGYIVYSDTIKDVEWNFFFGFTAKTIEQFEEAFAKAKAVFNDINRTPVFVLSPLCKVSNKVKKYIYSTYHLVAENVTLLTSRFDPKFDVPKEYTFRQIDNIADKELFIDTFKTSKTQTLPDDTYSALPPYYATALSQSFDYDGGWQFVHYLSLYKGQPVGMVSTCVKDEYCGIYGGGTYVKHRGKGVFTNLLRFIYLNTKPKNIKYYFGITEKNSKNEQYYNSIGWKSKFTTTLFK